MSIATPLRAPSPAVIDQLKAINNPEALFSRFQPLPKTHTKGYVWNKAMMVGSFVLAFLTGIAYKQAHKYATIAAVGLGLAEVYTLYKSRVVARIETPEFTAQKAEIKAVFDGVGPELRTTWEVASRLVAKAVQASKTKTVDKANEKAQEMLNAYLEADKWWVTADPIKADNMSQQPWREAYKTMRPELEKVAAINLDTYADAKKYNILIVDEIRNLQPEAVRCLRGKSPSDGQHSFVENVLEGADADAKVVSKPWTI